MIRNRRAIIRIKTFDEILYFYRTAFLTLFYNNILNVLYCFGGETNRNFRTAIGQKERKKERKTERKKDRTTERKKDREREKQIVCLTLSFEKEIQTSRRRNNILSFRKKK